MKRSTPSLPNARASKQARKASPLDLASIHRHRKLENALFGHAVTRFHSAVFKVAAVLPELVEFRNELDEHNATAEQRSMDAKSIAKRTKKAMKAKFEQSGVSSALELIKEATGANKEPRDTRKWYSKNTLSCREQHRLPCGPRSLTVSGFKPGEIYGPENIITGIYSESRGVGPDDDSNPNAGREGNRTLGSCVQWGLPPSGAGEAKPGRIMVLWEKKRFQPVLHVVKGVYYILEQSTDASDAAVLRLMDINEFMKLRLNGRAVEWRI